MSAGVFQRWQGPLFLLGSAALWGLAFVPQRLTTEPMGPLYACAFRFALAGPFALLVAGRRLRTLTGMQLRGAALLGVILGVSFVTQTAGITQTDVSRVSLITGLYAAFVPLLAPLFRLPGPRPLGWVGLLVSLAGSVLLVGALSSEIATPLNLGDLLTLACALLTAVHMLLIGRLAPEVDPWALNAVQLTVIFLCVTPAAFALETAPALADIGASAWWSFVYLAVFSSTVSFAFQISGQRTTRPGTAALIMLLEAPVGATFAALWLDERMTGVQLSGAGLLLVGVVLSIRADRSGA